MANEPLAPKENFTADVIRKDPQPVAPPATQEDKDKKARFRRALIGWAVVIATLFGGGYFTHSKVSTPTIVHSGSTIVHEGTMPIEDLKTAKSQKHSGFVLDGRMLAQNDFLNPITVPSGVKLSQGYLDYKIHRKDGTVVLCTNCPIHNTIVTAGKNYLETLMQTGTIWAMKYHGLGTSAIAVTVADTALTAELTTQYNPDFTRATGSLAQGASANIFQTVGTNTVDAGVTINEFGLFSAASAGTMWTHILTGSIALSIGDSLQTTYNLTIS